MSTMDLANLRLLAVFSKVVENGSFAAAARQLGSSRSRISEQVAQLEQSIGVRLLQRSTRQLNLTSEGRAVYEQARQLGSILQEVEAITTSQQPSGRVAITMNHDIAHKYVLPVLEGFQHRYPQIHLDLILDDARLDLIQTQIDLAIRIGFPKDDSVIARVMHEEQFAVFASPQYLQQHNIPKTVKELEQHSWILLKQGQGESVVRLRQYGKHIELKPERFHCCNSPLMMQHMVASGLGIGALLPTTVKEEIEEGRLIQLMPSLSSDTLVFSLVYPSRRQLPARTRAVIDYLLAADMFKSAST